jgi:hypothetical protein
MLTLKSSTPSKGCRHEPDLNGSSTRNHISNQSEADERDRGSYMQNEASDRYVSNIQFSFSDSEHGTTLNLAEIGGAEGFEPSPPPNVANL